MMKYRIAVSIWIAVSAVLIAAAGEVRTWTSTAGDTVDASYAGFENGVVILKQEDEALLQIHLNMLVPDDQEVARTLGLAAGHISDLGTGAITQAATNQLPAFADGIWKNQHTVYESEYYLATISADNVQLTIQIRENGENVGPAIRHNVGGHYGDLSKPPQQRHTPRRIARFDKPPEPALVDLTRQAGSTATSRTWPPAPSARGGGKHTVNLTGALDDDVPFTRSFEFEPRTIRVSSTLRDPSGIEYPTQVGYWFRVERSLDSGKYDSLDAIKEASKGWEITLDGRNMRADTFPFWPMIERVVGGLDTATFKGPWGSRTLHFDMPPSRIRGGNQVFTRFGPLYAGRPALDGFNIGRSFNLQHGEFSVTYTITIK